ncbi:MAG: diadenylate cyclase CdaA [Phycisphaerae bacterium]
MERLLRIITTYWNRITTYNLGVVMVELLLIGLVVWWVMRFLRGTRGARLIKGVAVMLITVYLVIRLLPEQFGWDRIEFLYRHFLLFAFVAGVVAFQPELRRALIQIGQARLFRSSGTEVERQVDALVDSSGYLSRNKIGAVLAIERTVGLGGLIESGTVLNAELTAPLLNTIFYPGTALHDMGVIIRDGRIAAAGCQFPLAESEDVDPSLGSRHRAALGLAQETDAVVLVVSEETGRVSLAYEGQLYLGLESETLREMILSLMAPPAFIRQWKKQKQKEAPTD